MKKKLKHWVDIFNERPRRERLIFGSLIVAVLVLTADKTVVTPFTVQMKALGQQQRTLTEELRRIQQQAEASGASMPIPEESQVQSRRNELQQLRAKVAESRLQALEPQRARDFLISLLPESSNVRLVGMRSLSKGSDDKLPGLYRHAIELKAEGSYDDLARYVERVEKAPWHMEVQGVSMQAVMPGKAIADGDGARTLLTMHITTYTMESKWLSLGTNEQER